MSYQLRVPKVAAVLEEEEEEDLETIDLDQILELTNPPWYEATNVSKNTIMLLLLSRKTSMKLSGKL